MIRVWILWLKVLWRSEHIWAFYVGLIILYLCKFVFFISELPVIIPIYGLFISIMTLIILNLPKHYHIEHIIKLTNCHPIRNSCQLWLFSLLCALPAWALLFATVSEIFTDTPVYLLMLVTFGLCYFAVSFAVACSLLPFKIAMLCCVVIYFLLILMHGYKLESIRYVAPTLNFMYPDYPDMMNILSIFFLGILMVSIYLWRGNDFPRRQKKWLLLFQVAIVVLYTAIPVGQLLQDKLVAKQSYQQFQINNIIVQYKGIPHPIATKYRQVVSDILDALHNHKINPEITEINITRLDQVPKGDQLEHIMKLQGTTLVIEPYSNKFYEFNYGYNIIRDMLELFNVNQRLRPAITRELILENKHRFFDSLQRTNRGN